MFPKGKNASDWKKACDGVMGILSTMGYSLGTLANYSGVDKGVRENNISNYFFTV